MSDQKGVLIKDSDGNVIEKRVYAGDTSQLETDLSLQDVSYEILDVSSPVFVEASTSGVISKDESDWKLAKAKGTTEALSFLAKQLGLE